MLDGLEQSDDEIEMEDSMASAEPPAIRNEEFRWKRVEKLCEDVKQFGEEMIDDGALASIYDFQIDKFQRLAIQACLRSSSVVVTAPTSSGKTLIAEAAAVATVAKGRRLFYTTPLKALLNQKFREFRETFGENNVGLLTGDSAVNEDAQVFIMTIEILRNMLYQRYIDYEFMQQAWGQLVVIYSRILENPYQQLDRYLNIFKELAGSRPLSELRTAEEAAAAGATSEDGVQANGVSLKSEIEAENISTELFHLVKFTMKLLSSRVLDMVGLDLLINALGENNVGKADRRLYSDWDSQRTHHYYCYVSVDGSCKFKGLDDPDDELEDNILEWKQPGTRTQELPLLMQFRLFYKGYAIKGTFLVNKLEY